MLKSASLLICLYLLQITVPACAGVIVAPQTVIDKNTTYRNTVLDMSHGSFIIRNNASLTIQNSKVTGTISSENPNLITLAAGKLILKNNRFTINSDSMVEKPRIPPLYYVIRILQGEAVITANHFIVSKSYTAGLLTTDKLPTSHLHFDHNTLQNLHGGILLRNTRQAEINDNKFIKVSSSNIFILEGGDNSIRDNTILFPGNNNVGDGIDVSDAENVVLNNNYIYSGSCYSLVIYHCKNIVIDSNIIIGGITYAVYITASNNFNEPYRDFYALLHSKITTNASPNQNIAVRNNYFSQNRYGLAATNVDGLSVTNNIFIQHFIDKISRKFWTNNDILLQGVTHADWRDNYYKEGYAQDNYSDKQSSAKLVAFPPRGGVVLE